MAPQGLPSLLSCSATLSSFSLFFVLLLEEAAANRVSDGFHDIARHDYDQFEGLDDVSEHSSRNVKSRDGHGDSPMHALELSTHIKNLAQALEGQSVIDTTRDAHRGSAASAANGGIFSQIKSAATGARSAQHVHHFFSDCPIRTAQEAAKDMKGGSKGSSACEGAQDLASYGCFGSCNCGWYQQCYPKWVSNQCSDSTSHGEDAFNVGVCGNSVPTMVVSSMLVFVTLLTCVVFTRLALQWEDVFNIDMAGVMDSPITQNPSNLKVAEYPASAPVSSTNSLKQASEKAAKT
mmetsp:Transcript_8382/g.18679  ORF Transcript_8382/g.18679 Transcript_8382/m.18679 type:complete len:292 (-) Transcript_8382:60-935(-)